MDQSLPSRSGASSRVPSPNRGQTVDAAAVNPGRQKIEEWRTEVGIVVEDQVKLVKLSHMWYQHKDFASTSKFLTSMYFVHAC
jgi:hypothetical protein